jgi:hypothetical protein
MNMNLQMLFHSHARLDIGVVGYPQGWQIRDRGCGMMAFVQNANHSNSSSSSFFIRHFLDILQGSNLTPGL